MVVALYSCKVVVMVTFKAVRKDRYFLLHLTALQKEDKIGTLTLFKSDSMADLKKLLILTANRVKPAEYKTQHLVVQVKANYSLE